MRRRVWLAFSALALAGMGMWHGAQPPELVEGLPERPVTTHRPIRAVPMTGGIAVMNGDIDYALFNGLVKTLAANPDITQLNLTSHGGLVPAARAMARQVGLRRMKVEAHGLCASACVLVFMAGEQRLLAEDAQLAFHRWHDKGMSQLFGQPDPEERDKAWLLERGLDAAFVAQIFDTPHDTLWKPTRAELLAAGVLPP